MVFNRSTAVALCIATLAAGAALADEPRAIEVAAPAIVVDLPAEPLRDEAPPVAAFNLQSSDDALAVLARTARSTDLRSFEAALASAKDVADAMPIGNARNEFRRALLVYEDVDSVWSYAMSDRSGAFFDDESLPGFRDRLRAYDGFESFIADDRVIDRTGHVFYASAETRQFLLAQLRHAEQAPVAVAATPRRAPVRKIRAAHAARAVAARKSQRVVIAPLPLPQPSAAAAPRPAAASRQATFAAARPMRADLAEPETGRGLIFVVLALIAGVLTLALRTPEDEVEAATGPLSVVPRADTLNDEPVTLRRRA